MVVKNKELKVMNLSDIDADRQLYSLTHPQRRIWVTEKIYKTPSMHNIGGSIKVNGQLNVEKLKQAFNLLIKHNDGLRLKIVEESDTVFQYVNLYEYINIPVVDFTNFEQIETALSMSEEWIVRDMSIAFEIENNDLFYFAIHEISSTCVVCYAKLHHLISDGWTFALIIDQLMKNYEQLEKQEDFEGEDKASYIYFIDKEKKYKESKAFEKNRMFWIEKLKDLPSRSAEREISCLKGKHYIRSIDEKQSLKIRKFLNESNYSMNAFFIAIYMIYLNVEHHYNDVVVGTPVYNRTDRIERDIIGMFTTTMPFRMNIPDNVIFNEVIESVTSELKKCYKNQKFPYDLLVKELGAYAAKNQDLFDVSINYYNTKMNSKVNGMTIETREYHNNIQTYNMEIIVRDWMDTSDLEIEVRYKPELYSQLEIKHLIDYFEMIIEQWIHYPENTILHLKEKRKLLLNDYVENFNQTAYTFSQNRPVHKIFEDVVKVHSQKRAISDEKNILTYEQMNRKVNQLAHHLVGIGVKKGSVVGVLTEHSVESVIGMMAVIKSGGAYLPIDPHSPSDRIRYMLSNAGVTSIITNLSYDAKIINSYEVVDLRYFNFDEYDAENLSTMVTEEDLAYIIYTSGSTGQPKGVMISHRGLSNYINWAAENYTSSNNEVFPLYSSLAFDLTVTSIFTPLICGCEIVVYRENGNEYIIDRIIEEKRATVVKLTPSHLKLIKEEACKYSNIKRFIVGGEDLTTELARRVSELFEGRVEIFNEYGPTETVVGCMIYKYSSVDNFDSVPIGKPIANTQIYILDDQLEHCRPGQVGEIYIAGTGVGIGYINNSEMTQMRFLECPYTNGKMYRTGDLGKFLDINKIQYIGRLDRQVKINSYRIELGEVESTLRTIEEVDDSVVVDYSTTDGLRALCAYYIKNDSISVKDIRRAMSKSLPHYMIPNKFIEIKSIPLTCNGKIDYEALLKIENQDVISESNLDENVFMNVIRDVLNIQNLDMSDHYFQNGGDSITAITISSRISEYGYCIEIKDILKNSIFEEMFKLVKKCEKGLENQAIETGTIKSVPIINWYLSNQWSEKQDYNQSILIDFSLNSKKINLNQILYELIEHHDTLRLNLNMNGELYYNNSHLNQPFHVRYFDISNVKEDEKKMALEDICRAIKMNIDLENELLFRAAIIKFGENDEKVFLTAHHLIIDGVSWRILLDDFAKMLKWQMTDTKGKLPYKTSSYKKWAERITSEEIFNLTEYHYWSEVVAKQRALNYLKSTQDDATEAFNINETIEGNIVESLKYHANNRFNTFTNELLLSALTLTLGEYVESGSDVIEVEGHGRKMIGNDMDLSRTIGWFTCIYPLQLNSSERNLSKIIKDVKENCRNIPNEGLGFGVYKYLNNQFQGWCSQNTLRFNYLGDFSKFKDSEYYKLSELSHGEETNVKNELCSILELNLMIIDEVLKINCRYNHLNTNYYHVYDFIEKFKTNVVQVVEYCNRADTVEFTPSDFKTVVLTQDELDNIFAG